MMNASAITVENTATGINPLNAAVGELYKRCPMKNPL